MKRCLAGAAALLVCSACAYKNQTDTTGLPSSGNAAGISFGMLSQAIFTPKCVSCHTGAGGGGGVDLSSYSGLMSGGAVVRNSPETSRLYTAVNSGSMPMGGAKLAKNEIDEIYAWIKDGAPENPTATLPSPTPAPTSVPSVTPAPTPVPTTPPPPVPTPTVTPVPTGCPAGESEDPVSPGSCVPAPSPVPTVSPPAPSPAPAPTPTPTPTTVTATFTSVFKSILQPRCVSCHTGSGAPRGIDLSSYASVMATGSVVAGNPGASLLYSATVSGAMPPSGGALSSSDEKLISDWISAGALNN